MRPPDTTVIQFEVRGKQDGSPPYHWAPRFLVGKDGTREEINDSVRVIVRSIARDPAGWVEPITVRSRVAVTWHGEWQEFQF